MARKPLRRCPVALVGAVLLLSCSSAPDGSMDASDDGPSPMDAAPDLRPPPPDLAADLASNGGVGSSCSAPNDLAVSSLQIESPDSQCTSGLCLLAPTHALCTKECTNDNDCNGADKSHCPVGFSCVPGFMSGPYSCVKLCICTSDAPVTTCP
jgi:hypothetical protein